MPHRTGQAKLEFWADPISETTRNYKSIDVVQEDGYRLVLFTVDNNSKMTE